MAKGRRVDEQKEPHATPPEGGVDPDMRAPEGGVDPDTRAPENSVGPDLRSAGSAVAPEEEMLMRLPATSLLHRVMPSLPRRRVPKALEPADTTRRAALHHVMTMATPALVTAMPASVSVVTMNAALITKPTQSWIAARGGRQIGRAQPVLVRIV